MLDQHLTETQVKNTILGWYHGTNEHVPVAQLEQMLADDVRMSYPNSPEPIIGIPAFRKWYADVLHKYFDETHAVEWWDIDVDGDTAQARVIVRWETRSLPIGDRVSQYAAFLSGQRFVVSRYPDSARVVIREKHVETFEPTAPIYGPFLPVGGPSGQCQNIDLAVKAARNADLASLGRWLGAGGNPNQYDARGWTPLLAASVRGHADAVEMLLGNPRQPANPDLPYLPSGALPIHFAGHSGDVGTAAAILEARPEHLDAVWNLNGHTLLLQAVFYGHAELARFSLKRGTDTSITTARGLGGLELARQFQNQPLLELIAPYDRPESEKRVYYEAYLRRIAPFISASELPAQQKFDKLAVMIAQGLRESAEEAGAAGPAITRIARFLEAEAVDVNRLGGSLQQPLLVVAVTGSNGQLPNPAVAQFREQLVALLLEHGASPVVKERHPMGVNAIIRAAVFNHLGILKTMGAAISPDALNEQPQVNGLTALHDTVLRAGTASADHLDGYLEQIRWFVVKGARSDIEDFSGATQRDLAGRIPNESRRQRVLEALGAD